MNIGNFTGSRYNVQRAILARRYIIYGPKYCYKLLVISRTQGIRRAIRSEYAEWIKAMLNRALRLRYYSTSSASETPVLEEESMSTARNSEGIFGSLN